MVYYFTGSDCCSLAFLFEASLLLSFLRLPPGVPPPSFHCSVSASEATGATDITALLVFRRVSVVVMRPGE